jgi:hypothetical protein
MPSFRVASFGSSSYLSANIKTDTASPTGVSLTFLPAVHRVRKARLAFDIAAADGFEIEIEFNDERFEEYTLAGQKKGDE